jgi:hypothetical protein
VGREAVEATLLRSGQPAPRLDRGISTVCSTAHAASDFTFITAEGRIATMRFT